MPFTFSKLEIPDLVLISPRSFSDSRGFFMETYKESDFVQNGIPGTFVQDNFSVSAKSVVRGLHFQYSPKAQGKLVRVSKGAIWDVAIDIREDSDTFMKWVSVELNDENRHIFWIPPGFAHGFASLSDSVHLQYKCTAEYDFDLDAGIRYDDESLNISWPIENPNVSEKDGKLPTLAELRESGRLRL